MNLSFVTHSDDPVFKGEKGVVLADPYVLAWEGVSTSLSNND